MTQAFLQDAGQCGAQSRAIGPRSAPPFEASLRQGGAPKVEVSRQSAENSFNKSNFTVHDWKFSKIHFPLADSSLPHNMPNTGE
ncbi:hypothetical protein MPC4_20285 [Methylocella tundrae]|uniref:Uncharacterized protein n=1 Tax=Methylocella tundrae TaxID=227605 RepID=A0A8B6M5G0_METTU|nr:hypothetical protein MPC1_10690002 [Methylocella tundrae]VTZ50075.1 hypothetical protein MPC4_20285 [Methylocella tundrae]